MAVTVPTWVSISILRRYVDDIFAIFKSKCHPIKFSKYAKHRNLIERKFLQLSAYMGFTSAKTGWCDWALCKHFERQQKEKYLTANRPTLCQSNIRNYTAIVPILSVKLKSTFLWFNAINVRTSPSRQFQGSGYTSQVTTTSTTN